MKFSFLFLLAIGCGCPMATTAEAPDRFTPPEAESVYTPAPVAVTPDAAPDADDCCSHPTWACKGGCKDAGHD